MSASPSSLHWRRYGDCVSSLIIASNRGPLSFRQDADGELTSTRGGGGLVSGLTAACEGHDALWVCAALTDGDRAAARGTSTIDESPAVRLLDIDRTTLHRAYNGIANSTLWFVHHHLWDVSRQPRFDAAWRRSWRAFEDYSASFAEAICEHAEEGARVLVQDYHLVLVPRLLRERRLDLRIGHFSHTPWATPDYYRLLPDDVAAQVLEGVLAADHIGFLTRRWADAFVACAERVLGAEPAADAAGRVGVHSLGIDEKSLRDRASEADVNGAVRRIQGLVGGRQLIVRVDRTELSKNVVRGLLAYRELLQSHPEWQGKVVHLALAYPSRHDLPEYREYTAEVQRVARDIVDELGTPEWTPLLLEVDDDYPRSLAAMRCADVLLVNPVRDGMNLVAKEGPVVTDGNLTLVLSREAGAAEELGPDALLVNPFDITGTASALHEALSMSASDRAERCARLAGSSTALPPVEWVSQQLAALAR
ncbi:MAG: trehalose 6-phosphate synthase [Frankiales bacterium]|nr:trehalose 6-phosphate synthase [Frankiales bacterium]